ncbi:MAG TPA: prepilin-type N-terminal cleavage/methylation domain-containing protein, partial [Gemmatimonadaceae bacterium]|nr:prepilin-type N-terminal cleavage/methylation domain-containing protein [Gemmatimonadaceae bacterium]
MTMNTMRPRAGMTLMELVIGLAITGMMAAAGAGAFASIIDHRRGIREASVSTERAAALREMIHSWLVAGTVQIQQGGGPRGLTRGIAAGARAQTRGGN